MSNRLIFGLALGFVMATAACGSSDDGLFGGEVGGSADAGAGTSGSAGVGGGAAGKGGGAQGGASGKGGNAQGGASGQGGTGVGGASGQGGTGEGGASGQGGTGEGGASGQGGTGQGGASGQGGQAGASGQAGAGGLAGQGGAAGQGGSAGQAGQAGAAGSGGTCGGSQDKCPGVVITLTGTGSNPRLGQATGVTTALCSDYQGSCGNTANSRDAVFQITPDISGVMTVDTAGSAAVVNGYDPVIYLRTTCGNQGSELKCADATPPNPDTIIVPVDAGTTYYVVLDSYGDSAGAYQLNVKVQPPVCSNSIIEHPEECDDGNLGDGDGCSHLCQLEPGYEHDKCPGLPLTLTGTATVRTGTATGTTATMKSDYAGSCGSSGSANDVVYWVTAPFAGTMSVNLGGAVETPFDAVLYVRTACGDGATQLSCDDSTTDGDESLTLKVQAGQTYYIFVDGFGSSSGAYTLHVKLNAPECGNLILDPGEQCDDGNHANNDGCTSSCALEAVNNDKCPGYPLTMTASGANLVGTVTGTTETVQADYQGSCGTSSVSRDAVYQFSSTFGGIATATITAASYDSVVYARSGTCDSGAQLDCDDKTGHGLDTITFNVLPSTNYWVFVDGFNGDSGTFTLQVTVSPAECGNTKLEGTEQCDDGNLTPGDGCSAQCTLEAPGPNDTCPGKALTLTQSGQQWVGSVVSSTINLNANYAGTCGSSSGAKDAVYQFNSGPGGKVVATIATASFDSVLYARTGDCASGTEVECDDEYADGGDTITFNSLPNTTYWLFVDGYSSEFGAFTMNVTVTPAVCGNGYIEGSEQCDDANATSGDGCSACAWEGSCGTLLEAEPNAYNTPQAIPAACKSFLLTAAMPQGDADYFLINLVAGQTITASTFVGTPGACSSGADTVISLWNSPLTPTNESGACTTAGYLQCNDTDSLNSPCATFTHLVAATGTYILKVHDYFTTKSIASYGVYVTVH